MAEEKSIHIRVPGTSANCGPGFDTLGLACTIYNDLEMSLRREPGVDIETTGEGALSIPKDETNVVWTSAQYLLKKAGMDKEYPGVRIRMHNRVPISRGLGSSAAAIVGGLKAADILIGNPYSRRELLQFATEIEGHPDNVAPAIFGGFTVNIREENGETECYAFRPKLWLKLVVAVPNFPLPTKKAREVLPDMVSRQDAVFNAGRVGMMVGALCRGNARYLEHVFEDRLHQPYRESLIPGMPDVLKAAKDAGALGASLSGAGPCLIAFVLERKHCAKEVGEAMKNAFSAHDVDSRYLILDLDTHGAHVAKQHANRLEKEDLD